MAHQPTHGAGGGGDGGDIAGRQGCGRYFRWMDHSLALASDGSRMRGAYNYSGQLGIGSYTTRQVPVAVTTAGTSLLARRSSQ